MHVKLKKVSKKPYVYITYTRQRPHTWYVCMYVCMYFHYVPTDTLAHAHYHTLMVFVTKPKRSWKSKFLKTLNRKRMTETPA